MSMHSTWMSFRSLTQDSSVKNQKLKPGTLKRIASFAIPYRISLSLFLITVVIDALLIVATPLLLRRLIDEGVIPKNSELVTQLALAVGVIALLDALFSMIGRWFSARIGEGLIYDLRSMIFEHVQRQSIAFFTRTQTGALISRLNSDVIGAQQAFTSTLSGVISNVQTLIIFALMGWLLGNPNLSKAFKVRSRWRTSFRVSQPFLSTSDHGDPKRSRVQGTVKLKIYKGNVSIVSRISDKSIYSMKNVSFEENKTFNKKRVENFIKKNARLLRKQT